ncbi:Uncharacterised protein [[Clostridium] sordellii]|nr:Uncharacterised protein [[Clostridium] sordellii] [Paeniclostridium sordellii]
MKDKVYFLDFKGTTIEFTNLKELILCLIDEIFYI